MGLDVFVGANFHHKIFEISLETWPNNSRAHSSFRPERDDWASGGAPGRVGGSPAFRAAMRSAKRRKLRPASCDFGASVRFEDHWYVDGMWSCHESSQDFETF